MPDPSNVAVRRVFKTPLGTATEISSTSFLQRVLPPLRHGMCPDIIDRKLKSCAKKSSTLKPITLQNRWRGFAQDPALAACSVEDAFRHFPDAVEAIIKAGRAVSGQLPLSTSFRNNPNCEMWYLNRVDGKPKYPDAYLTQGDGLSWSSIIASGEHQKTDSKDDVIDNASKVLASMSRCMYHDPRRRFTFAYTIENASMRLWYCDRSQILVSESFKFITEREPMIHFFLSLIYAEPQELGWDSTMTLLQDRINYDIRVDGFDGTRRTYRTLQLLSSAGLGDVRQGGTRAWKAVLLENGGPSGTPVVLKDAWVDADRMAEGFILEEIRKSDYDPDDREFMVAAFPTLLFHGDVFMDLDKTALDYTSSFLSGAHSATDVTQISKLRLGHALAEDDQVAMKSAISSKRCKVHYRIVLKEVGTPIQQEQSLCTIFELLAQVAWILRSMHMAGWVHHDISLGNIIVVNERAMLLDMEYAQKVDQGSGLRIGTPSFMAVEVDRQEYLFRPSDVHREPSKSPPKNTMPFRERILRLKVSLAARTDHPVLVAPAPSTKAPRPVYPFRYNALHDLESLWWIGVYFVFKRQVVDTSKDEVEAQAIPVTMKQRVVAAKLLQNLEDRFFAICIDTDFAEWIKDVPPVLQPHAHHLHTLRCILAKAYRRAEKDLPSIDLDPEVHDRFTNVLLSMAPDDMKHIMLRPFPPIYADWDPLEPATPEPVVSGTKRSFVEVADDHQSSERNSPKRAKTRTRSKQTKPVGRTRPYLPRNAKTQHRSSA